MTVVARGVANIPVELRRQADAASAAAGRRQAAVAAPIVEGLPANEALAISALEHTDDR